MLLRGTAIGTQTDFNGNFTLTVRKTLLIKPEVLVISYLGYDDLELKVSSTSSFIAAQFTLEEVMVMGYLDVHRRSIFRRIRNLFRRG